MSLRGSTNGQVSKFFKDAAALSPLKTKPKLYPFSLRFTEEEREWLLHRAGTLSLAAYIRLQLFKDFENSPLPRRKTSRKVGTPSAELAVLGKMLGNLGQSQFASNLDQIAKAAHQGALPVTPEVEAELLEACDAIQDMRSALILALGVKVQ